MTKTPTPPHRRWFQFSLQGLLVGLTLLAIPLGWAAYQLNWIRQRHRFLEEAQADWDALTATQTATDAFYNASAVAYANAPDPAPRVLRPFGERGYGGVYLHLASPTAGNLDADDQQRLNEAHRLFPEAGVIGCHFNRQSPSETWTKYFFDQPQSF